MTLQDYLQLVLSMPQAAANISPPSGSLPGPWSPEQQAIIDRINSGRTDYTFGPGSPNPTQEDLQTYVGGRYSPASGFAVQGGVALAPSEYNQFSPEQRRALGIMDIAPKNQAGKIERYFGPAGGNSAPPGLAGAPSGSDAYERLWQGGNDAFAKLWQGEGTGGFDYAKAGKAAGSALQDAAAKIAQQGQQSTDAAMKLMMNRQKDPRLQALVQADPLAPLMAGGGAESAYVRQLYDKYFGPTPTIALQPDFTDTFPLMG